MNDTELLEPFQRMLTEICPPGVVRDVENGQCRDTLWTAFEESGFLDAMVPEPLGGAGLSLAQVAPLLMALGGFAVPVPVGETMLARGLLAADGHEIVEGTIGLDTGARNFAPDSPCDRWLSEVDGRLVLSPERRANGVPSDRLMRVAAVIRACFMAGAADRALEMTIGHANERAQFGKPIGKQQAVQHQLAVMAEEMVSCRIAAQIGCAGSFPPQLAAAAVAKQVTSAAAGTIAGIAHAVHGAIGISAEYDLQLFTRRLHQERVRDGSATYWARRLGEMRLSAAAQPSVDFVRSALA